jgi:hypothetical protein
MVLIGNPSVYTADDFDPVPYRRTFLRSSRLECFETSVEEIDVRPTLRGQLSAVADMAHAVTVLMPWCW